MDDLIQDFLNETRESLQELERLVLILEHNPTHMESIRSIFQALHTIKGTCGFFGFERMQRVAHGAENILSQMRDGEKVADTFMTSALFIALDTIRNIVDGIQENGSEQNGDDEDLLQALNQCLSEKTKDAENTENVATKTLILDTELEAKEEDKKNQDVSLSLSTIKAELSHTPFSEKTAPLILPSGNQTIRISVDTVDDLMNLVGELVLTRNQLWQQNEKNKSEGVNIHTNVLTRLSYLTTDLQQTVMKTRMQSIENAWAKLPRMVRDIARTLGKKIDLIQMGADTELDRQVIECIKDPLVHMVRNSADHGIELPEERRAQGKPETGTITLKAYHHGGHIFIEIADDGKGMDSDKIRTKAIQKGILEEKQSTILSREQILQLIFKPGFSTAENVTHVSGRGVGMDVVKTNIEKLGGTVELQSCMGKGSTFILKIPLTLSIISALLVKTGGQIFALPQMSIIEILNLRHSSSNKIEKIEGKSVLRWRNQLISVLNLADLLNISSSVETKGRYIVIFHILHHYFGLEVEGIFDSQEIVVKPLSKILKHLQIFSGSTILGNGQVVLILDPNHFDPKEEQRVSLEEKKYHALEDVHSKNATFLIFKIKGETRAVPLAFVRRIDEISVKNIEKTNDTYTFFYRGQLIPLLEYEGQKEEKSEIENKNDEENLIAVLIFMERGYKIAFHIDALVDIQNISSDIQLSGNNEDILGTVVIHEKPIPVMNSQYFFKKIYPHFQHYTGKGEKEKKSGSLLIVHESKFFLNRITPLLNVCGFFITTTTSMDEALALCRNKKNPFDVVISKIDMPEKSGYDLLTDLQKNPLYKNVPILAISESEKETPEDAQKIKDAGFFKTISQSDQQGLIQILMQLGQNQGEEITHV